MIRRPHVAAALMLVAWTAACGSPAPPPAGPPAPAKTLTVDVTAVTSNALKATMPLSGELQPYESVAVFPKIAGFVTSIDVDRGSVVKKGQVMAKLEAPELVAQRAEAQAKLQSVRAELAAAQTQLASDDATYQRLKRASATAGVVAGNDLESSGRLVDADRQRVTAQEEQVNAATNAAGSIADVLAYLDISAPFDGVVTERNVHPGALVSPPSGAGMGVPMLRLETMSRLRLVVPVPEAYVAGITSGQTVDFTVSSYPGRTFSGKVARVAHSIEVKTRTMPVEIDVENSGGDLASGTFAEVRWPIERRAASLFVPPSAVASTLDRTFVVCIRDGKAEWVDVRTGVMSGKLVEVFGDLQAGDQVAVRGTDELKQGSHVAVHVVANQ